MSLLGLTPSPKLYESKKNSPSHMIDTQMEPKKKQDLCNPLIHTITKAYKINNLIVINIGVRGAIHEKSVTSLEEIYTCSPSIMKKAMKAMHQTIIKYLTYVILNKRKLDNKQEPVAPPKPLPPATTFVLLVT